MKKLLSFFIISISLFIVTFATGCQTTGQRKGYYNPPPANHSYSTGQNIAFNGQFNGQNVAVYDQQTSREQQSWVRLSMQQQAQNHYEAMDRARQAQWERQQAQQELQQKINIGRQIVYTINNLRRY